MPESKRERCMGERDGEHLEQPLEHILQHLSPCAFHSHTHRPRGSWLDCGVTLNNAVLNGGVWGRSRDMNSNLLQRRGCVCMPDVQVLERDHGRLHLHYGAVVARGGKQFGVVPKPVAAQNHPHVRKSGGLYKEVKDMEEGIVPIP